MDSGVSKVKYNFCLPENSFKLKRDEYINYPFQYILLQEM